MILLRNNLCYNSRDGLITHRRLKSIQETFSIGKDTGGCPEDAHPNIHRIGTVTDD
jgi:hypothetical protein